LIKNYKFKIKNSAKKFMAVNFGCRVNSAEINQLSQKLINQGYVPTTKNPDMILVNTCAVTKKGEYESLSKIKQLRQLHPLAKILVSGCANLSKIPPDDFIKQIGKTNIVNTYTPQIKDKFSHTHRYLLKVQSGCTINCTFCIVPFRRPQLEHLPIDTAVEIVNQAIGSGYTEIIITGVNLAQYPPGLSNLVEALLTKTTIPLISFGSIPLLCIDDQFINLLSTSHSRLSTNLHIPIQSGSNKILKLMHRPYTKQKIIDTLTSLREALGDEAISFGTDIIVGFPLETDTDFQETYDLCQSIGFSKIHVFRYSPRPNTPARELFLKSKKIPKDVLSERSKKIRCLIHKS
jgi:threonylcarbamoyladenosine tRNA methylthiotransferase MtaB